MTTIAFNYKDKEIAVDSRFTKGDLITTDKANKVFKRDGVIFVMTGSTKDYEKLIDIYFGAKNTFNSIECSAFVVDSGLVYEYGFDCNNNDCKELADGNMTLGSGGDFALAAMDFGCSAKDAVKYAMTRDIYTGGTVKVIKVK